MRVLYVIPRYGPQFISNETHGQVVAALREQGCEVDVLSFTTRDGGGGPGGWGAGFGSERVYRHVSNATLGGRLVGKATSGLLHYDHLHAMMAGIIHVAQPNAYDLMHIEGTYPLGAAAALTMPIHVTPFVVTTTGGDVFTLPEQNYGYGQYRLPKALISLALRKAAWVRANSTMIARLAAEAGASPARTSVLPVSIGDDCYPPAGETLDAFRARSRAELGAEYGWGERRVISVVGRLFNLKAQELLIEALPAINAALGPTQACIVGPSREDAVRGDYRRFLEETAARLGVSELCTFTGFVPNREINRYLAASDLLAVPSLIEGLNRVVIEAAAVGTPSVVSDGAGAAELIATYGCGLIVPRGSSEALAHACVRALGSERGLEQLRAATEALGEAQRAENVARELISIYRRI